MIKKLLLKDVILFLAGKVTIYEETGSDDFEDYYADLYVGLSRNVPSNLLNRTVKVIGSHSDDGLQIEVYSVS